MNLTIKLTKLSVLSILIILSGCAFLQDPDAPKDLTAVYNEAGDYVELHWDEVSGAKDYEIYRGVDENSIIEYGDNDEAWYDDFDYDYLERYYAVKAKNNAGTSEFSEVVEANVPLQDKYEPDNDIASASTIDLSGDAPSQKHSIRPAGDVDYIAFSAEPCPAGIPCGYNIGIPSQSCEPDYIKLELFDSSGNLLESDDQGSGDDIARIGEWVPTVAGNYYIKVSSTGSGYYRIFIINWQD